MTFHTGTLKLAGIEVVRPSVEKEGCALVPCIRSIPSVEHHTSFNPLIWFNRLAVSAVGDVLELDFRIVDKGGLFPNIVDPRRVK